MEITEVRIKLMEEPGERLKAFCSITFDDCFVVRDLKIIEGTSGPFVAMPSRKLTSHCQRCGMKNHLRAGYCNQCGAKQEEGRAPKDADGRAKLYADIAHPINSDCREMIQERVIQRVFQGNRAGEAARIRFALRRFRLRIRRNIASQNRPASIRRTGHPRPLHRGTTRTGASATKPTSDRRSRAAMRRQFAKTVAHPMAEKAKASAPESFLNRDFASRNANALRGTNRNKYCRHDDVRRIVHFACFCANIQVRQKCALSLTDIFSAGGKVKMLLTP